MDTLLTFRAVDCPCDETWRWLNGRLTQAGMRVMQTFDLQDTRLQLEGCTCPHHGTQECDCQLMVGLVYGTAAEPATLMLHGHDGHTWIYLIDRPEHVADARLVAAIQAALASDRTVSTGSPPSGGND